MQGSKYTPGGSAMHPDNPETLRTLNCYRCAGCALGWLAYTTMSRDFMGHLMMRRY